MEEINPIQVKIDADARKDIEARATKKTLCYTCKELLAVVKCDNVFGSDRCAEVLLIKLVDLSS